MDGARHSGRLHTAGQVHGVAPEIVDELSRSNDTRHDRPGVETDSDLQVGAVLPIELPKNAKQVESYPGYRASVVRSPVGQTAHRHVAITDGLDLFDAVPLTHRVEPAKQVIQQRNQFGGRSSGRE